MSLRVYYQSRFPIPALDRESTLLYTTWQLLRARSSGVARAPSASAAPTSEPAARKAAGHSEWPAPAVRWAVVFPADS
jgi:hypothetical protein